MIEAILSQIVPALVGTILAQRAPDHLVPVVKNPQTVGQSMTLIGAIVVILLTVEAVQTKRLDAVDAEQVVAAAAVVWGVLPRAHQILDALGKLCRRH